MHLFIVFTINLWILFELILLLFVDFSICQRQRGTLIFQEEFDKNDLHNSSRWKHWITAFKETPSEFQYFHKNTNNRLRIIYLDLLICKNI